jgi:hypothetical protein
VEIVRQEASLEFRAASLRVGSARRETKAR